MTTRADAPSTPKRILVVDDNVDGAELLSIVLSHAGHDVVVANDCASALEEVAARPPEIAFIDIGLPEMSGYDLLAVMRKLAGGAAIRAIAVTGHASDDDRARSREAGFAAHLTKPVRLEHVLAAVVAVDGPG